MNALVQDVFPAEVVLPDGRVERRARVFFTDQEVVVVGERDGGSHVVAYRGAHTADPVYPYRNAPRNRAQYSATTADGTLTATRVGCACGSPLISVTLDQVEREATQ